jgi:hypothetical protein
MHRRRRRRLSGFPGIVLLVLIPCGLAAAVSDLDFQQPPHDYWTRPLHDPVTQLKTDLESGRLALDRSTERAFLLSLLQALRIPASSQILVFSTTSLQLRLISPSNPRALYFNDEVYVGFIPGGRVEVVSLDPELGGVFYIFDIPRGAESIRLDRSDRCMNCHAGEDTDEVPGLVLRSVLPGPSGGSIRAFRGSRTGHGVPFQERFGGWFVTGQGSLTNHWGNQIGQYSPNGPSRRFVEPGTTFDFARYAAPTSDVLPHLLHEHQVGFLNRIIHAGYRARACLHEGMGKLLPEHEQILDQHAQAIVRYLLFADEIALPTGGVSGDPLFKKDFLARRRTAGAGDSLRDFDLETRLFRYRCSYMIYTAPFEHLPGVVKSRVYVGLKTALSDAPAGAAYAYLPGPEKRAIQRILRETLPDLPQGW